MKIEIEITDSNVAYLLCSALEGGSNYWMEIGDIRQGEGDAKPWGNDYTPTYISAPFCKNGSVEIIEVDEDTGKQTTHKLTRARLESGLKLMAKEYGSHFGDFTRENGDAITGDVFLQCCVLGEVRYG